MANKWQYGHCLLSPLYILVPVCQPQVPARPRPVLGPEDVVEVHPDPGVDEVAGEAGGAALLTAVTACMTA